MGKFVIKSKKTVDEMKVGDELSESDFAMLSTTGQFVQMEYIEDEDKIVPYDYATISYMKATLKEKLNAKT